MERVHLRPISWRGRALLSLALLVFVSGPQGPAWLVSAAGGLVTVPVTGEFAPSGDGFEVFNLQLLLVYAIAVIGLNLVLQTGVLSIGHTIFFALGAYLVAILTVEDIVNFPVALVLAVVASGLLGLLLALPLLRLGLFTFVMMTLGYAIISQDLSLAWRQVTGGGDGISGVSEPEMFGIEDSYYYVILAFFLIALHISRMMLRSSTGRAAKAVETSVPAAETLGIDGRWIKLRAFALSAALTGLAGGLFAPLLGFVSPEVFALDLAILFVLMVILGGAGTLAGPLVGLVLLFRLPIEISQVVDNPGDWSLIIYAVTLLVVARFAPKGLMSVWWWLVRRVGGRFSTSRDLPVEVADDDQPKSAEQGRGQTEHSHEIMLSLRSVSKSYGAVRVLHEVDLDVRQGAVHSVIGPNGAGKTSLFNVVSGFTTVDGGQIALRGDDITSIPTTKRAKLGIGRTFQHPLIFSELSVIENVLVAFDQQSPSRLIPGMFGLRSAWKHEARKLELARDMLGVVGLQASAELPASLLSPGERRLLEIARVKAQSPRVVLLDEPAGGLSESEMAGLERIIESMKSEGVAVLLIEHHVDLVARVSDEVTVLNFGEVLAHGTSAEVFSSAAVSAAYLGDGFGEISSESEGLA